MVKPLISKTFPTCKTENETGGIILKLILSERVMRMQAGLKFLTKFRANGAIVPALLAASVTYLVTTVFNITKIRMKVN